MTRILIFANGDLPNPDKARLLLQEGDLIISADGGTRHALALGCMPNLLLGDLDSITMEEKGKLEQAGVAVIQFPRDKDQTDLELALSHAIGLDPSKIIIVGALGGRMDQTLANLLLLTDARLSSVDVRMDDGVEEIFLCRGRARIHGRSGEVVSLIPWGGEVTGVVTENLKWPLHNESLRPEKTRGISNEMLGEEAVINIETGTLLVVHRRPS